MSKQSAARHELEAVHPLWRWFTLLISTLAFLIVATFGILWGYHAAKIWRAHNLARAAMETLDHQSTTDVEDKLLAAYHLTSQDAEVLRACARYQAAINNPQALGFYQELLRLPEATRADRRTALRASLTFGNFKLAEELMAGLKTAPLEPDDMVCEAQMRWAEHGTAEAVARMRQGLALAPDNRSYQLLLAQMLASADDDASQKEAMESFQKLAQVQDRAGLEALVAISRSTGLDKDSLRSVLAQIRRHPLLDETGRFAAWELEARLGDRDPKEVLQGVVDYYQSADLPHKSTAARWLYGHNQPELALKLASPPETSANKDLFLVRLDALGYLKNWAEVEKELEDPQAPLTQTLVFLYRARAAQELGDPEKSQYNWEKARTAATKEAGMLDYLGSYAVNMRLYDEAKKTFIRIAKTPSETEKGYAALLELEAEHGSSSELLESLEEMTRDLPQKPEPKNDWAYLSLLLNTNVDKACSTAESLVAAHPEVLAYRSTLALGRLRRHDFAGAAKVYQGLQIDWQTAPASWKMVYALVLAANGATAGAQDLARTINRAQLRKEERGLLDFNLPGTEPENR
jgi:Tfp pilus assembly protein PilF